MNELRHVYDIGGIAIRLHRPGVGPANEEEARTIAEIDLQYPHLPQVVNDGTIQDAAEKVRGILYGQAAVA